MHDYMYAQPEGVCPELKPMKPNLNITVGKKYNLANGGTAVCVGTYKLDGDVWAVMQDGHKLHTVNVTTGAVLFSSVEHALEVVGTHIERPVVDWSKERDWVKAIAMGNDTRWYRYDSVPMLLQGVWRGNGYTQLMHPSEYPTFDGDWKDSLVTR
jgi:hypothetical protein